ncbi:MAG: ABC transporter ATP-binding protein [Planctomycetota bacterium]
MDGSILETSGLVVRYGQNEALRDVSMCFQQGALGLLGPNGAGKSSLLRVIFGLIRPARGTVRVMGLDAARDGARVRACCGYMPESDCHIPGLSGLEFTAFCGRISGLNAADAKRRAHEVLVYTGLQEERYRKVDEYSRGMKQKVKFAAALVHDPAVLFLDEPTNGLDPQARLEVLELIRDLVHNKGMNVVLSSHLLQDVDSVCEEVIVLDQGKVRTSGRIDELKQSSGGFVVKVHGGIDPFCRLAAERGFKVKRDDRGSMLVLDGNADGAFTIKTMFEIGRDAGTPVRHVVPAEESLEDLFLRTLEEAEQSAGKRESRHADL